MNLDINKLYVLISDTQLHWCKPIGEDGDYFRYLSAMKSEDIKDVDVSDRNNYLVKSYHSNGSGRLIYTPSDLMSPVDLSDVWYNTIDEEIEGDYNGDINLWMQSRRLHVEYHEPSDKYGNSRYKVRYIRKNLDFMCIKYDYLEENFPELFSNDILIGGSILLKTIKRDYRLDCLLQY